MRCLVLGALVIIASTGCGGPSEDPNPELRSAPTDMRKEWNARSAADQAAIRKYSTAFSRSAIETCVIAYDDDTANAWRFPVEKPGRGDLGAYLCDCLGASICL